MSINYLVFYWPALPRSTSIFSLVLSCLWALFFSYPDVCFSVRMRDILLFILACVAANLFFAWLVSVHVSVHYAIAWLSMSCRLISSGRFQCYPCGAWRMPSSQPWFFFESPCLHFCLWSCVTVPGRHSFLPSLLSGVDIYSCGKRVNWSQNQYSSCHQIQIGTVIKVSL